MEEKNKCNCHEILFKDFTLDKFHENVKSIDEFHKEVFKKK